MKARVKYLDFIRAFSTVAIIVFHFNCSIGLHHTYAGDKHIIFYDYLNGNLGQIGVSLFFILSGASLMYTYSKSLDIKKYFIKRWIGIFPAFYLAYFGVVLYYFWIYKSLNPFGAVRKGWTFILTIIGMDGITTPLIANYYVLGEWFLGCIIILYSLFPLFRKLLIKVSNKVLFGVIFLVEVVFVETYNFDYPIEYVAIARMAEFVFGMIVVYSIKKINVIHVMLAAIGMIVMFNIYIPINQMYKTALMGILFFLILGYIGERIPNSYIIQKLSKQSYFIFLIHHIIIEQVCSRYESMRMGILSNYVLLTLCFIIIMLVANLFGYVFSRIMDVIVPQKV